MDPERKALPPLMLELITLTEGLLKLRHITAFVFNLLVPCSLALQKLAAKPTTHHPTATALLLDLLLFKPDLKANLVDFSPDLSWSPAAAWKPLAPLPTAEDEMSIAMKAYQLPPAGKIEDGPYVHI